MTLVREAALSIITICWLTTAGAQKNFLVISDIHLDDADNQSAIARNARNAGADTWDTAQLQITRLIKSQSPKFIVYLGDLPLHVDPPEIATAMTNAGETLKTLRDIAQQHHIPLIFVPGNNDSPDSDYGKFSPALFQCDTAGAKAWPAIGTTIIKTSENLYPQTGCYAAYPLGRKAKLRVIVLNTVLYTWNYRSADHTAECEKQASWLGRQLHEAEAGHETALIVMHVPPGIDTYKGKTFWTTNVPVNGTTIQNNFLDTLAQYKNNIMGLLTSHTHMDGFKRLYDKDGKFITLLISVPAIAPSAFNNTAIKLIRYNKKKQFTKSTTYYHVDAWHSNAIAAPNRQPLNAWFQQMDSTDLYKMVDTLYNTGVKAHNKALDLDVYRKQ